MKKNSCDSCPLKNVTEITSFSPTPDSVLVLSIPRYLSMSEIAKVKEIFKAAGLGKVIFIPDSCKIEEVARSGLEDDE